MLKYLEDVVHDKTIKNKLIKKYEEGKLVVADIGKRSFITFLALKKEKVTEDYFDNYEDNYKRDNYIRFNYNARRKFFETKEKKNERSNGTSVKNK